MKLANLNILVFSGELRYKATERPRKLTVVKEMNYKNDIHCWYVVNCYTDPFPFLPLFLIVLTHYVPTEYMIVNTNVQTVKRVNWGILKILRVYFKGGKIDSKWQQ